MIYCAMHRQLPWYTGTVLCKTHTATIRWCVWHRQLPWGVMEDTDSYHWDLVKDTDSNQQTVCKTKTVTMRYSARQSQTSTGNMRYCRRHRSYHGIMCKTLAATIRYWARHRQLPWDTLQDTDSYYEILCKTKAATMRYFARHRQLLWDTLQDTGSYHEIPTLQDTGSYHEIGKLQDTGSYRETKVGVQFTVPVPTLRDTSTGRTGMCHFCQTCK